MKVTLRKKQVSGNRQTLYLDFYPPIVNPETGKSTRREFLKLFIYDKPKTALDKLHNKETLQIAETAKAQRQLELQQGNFGFLSKRHNGDFLEYFNQIAEKHERRNRDIWLCALQYLKRYAGENVKFSDVDVKFCNGFREYLLTAPRLRSRVHTISQNSAYSYFNKLRAALKQAFREGIIKQDITFNVERIKEAETHREYLSLEELNALAKAECELPILKRAALFSALTGLRFSDIQKLIWSEVRENDGRYILQFKQQKTKGAEVMPIASQAFQLLGERESSELVFEGLNYSAFVNFHLKRWVLKAGISKNITFHCFRHTYATLQLSMGTDIYTVSKMLGHRELKTTQIYAKIMDQAKEEATKKITIDF